MPRNKLTHQVGFSLLELLIALVINLVIVIAAAYLYLGTADSRKATDQQQIINENGQYALNLIGHDIVNAGFYPTIRVVDPAYIPGTTQRLVRDTYTNIMPSKPTAYNSGMYGCQGKKFDVATNLCAAHSTSSNNADTVVINYFTTDAMGDDKGQRLDCGRSDVDSAAVNTNRIDNAPSSATYSGATSGLTPKAPLFVSNRYTLVPSTVTIENRIISTLALACSGIASQTYQPAVTGIEQLRFRYGVFTSDITLSPSRLYRADSMPSGTVEVNGEAKAAWGRTVSVEVCLVARALEASQTRTASGAQISYTDCDGTNVIPTDGVIRRVYRKVFALRNVLTQTIIPQR